VFLSGALVTGSRGSADAASENLAAPSRWQTAQTSAAVHLWPPPWVSCLPESPSITETVAPASSSQVPSGFTFKRMYFHGSLRVGRHP
jgi:hypothetical protein